jgi:branched-chain amino acid transport system ATP-binding protein
MPAPVLSFTNLRKAFGAIVVAEGLDFTLAEGEAVGIIGPNGAGKSTLFNLITGDLAPSGGTILFRGRDLLAISPHRRCREGIGRSYQIPHPFGKMSVYENVLTAAVFGALEGEAQAAERTVRVLDVTGLLRQANNRAGALTLLQRKRLELARALATDPSLLLLDEIAGGLTEHEVKELVATIRDVRATGVSLIWIEHVVHALLATVDRIVVLSGGRFVADGPPAEVMKSDVVRQTYLGSAPA